jgi:hypothetical protein
MSKIINALLEKEKINISELERKIDLKRNTIHSIIRRNYKISQDFLRKCLKCFPELNPEWLITEEGEMYKSQIQQVDDYLTSDGKFSACANSKSLEADLRYTIDTQKKIILHLEEKLSMREKKEFQYRTFWENSL